LRRAKPIGDIALSLQLMPRNRKQPVRRPAAAALRAAALLLTQKEALEMVARQAPVADLLDFLARAVESQMQQGTTAAIHLLNPQGTHFASAAAPSLPPEYVQATVGMAIDSQIDPCCAAVASREPVIVTDVAGDPRFPRFGELALPWGIRAGWCTPILSAAGTALGTFAVYYPEPRAPRKEDHELLGILTRTVALSLERARAHVDQALLAAIVTSSDDAIVSKDLDGVITSWNRGAQRLFGYTAEEAVGRPVTMLIPPEHSNEEPEILARIRRGEIIDHYETVRRRKDGTLLDISLTVSPLHDAQGRVIGASKVARDITQRKQADAALKEQAAALADLHRRKDEFLAMLSHELRNPLAPITNALELLRLQRGSGNPTEEHARTVIERQVGQLKHLVDDLLEVSRVTTGNVRLRRDRVDLGGIASRAVETARPLIEQRRHELRVSVPPEPIWLHGDPARLEQVVVNLLTNAAKYTAEGGRIRLAVAQEDGRVALRVRDTGMGIAPELLPRIFDLFTQAERSLERADGGLGIGLSLVKRLVELHGGTVEATSAVGQGSEFVVRLPLGSPPPTASASTVAAALSTARSSRVLVVDDNVDAADSLAMMLAMFGHDVRTAHDGEAALEVALGWRPEVVLLDIGLPGLDGFEVARRMRRHPSLRDVVLVALTGYGQDTDRQRSQEAGFDRHLVKPVAPATVQGIVASVPQRGT
jgi:two-component system CheB/CheR fusion protein